MARRASLKAREGDFGLEILKVSVRAMFGVDSVSYLEEVFFLRVPRLHKADAVGGHNMAGGRGVEKFSKAGNVVA